MGGEGERYGNEKGNRESDQRAEQLQNGVAKLREGSAGDHVADFREAGVVEPEKKFGMRKRLDKRAKG